MVTVQRCCLGRRVCAQTGTRQQLPLSMRKLRSSCGGGVPRSNRCELVSCDHCLDIEAALCREDRPNLTHGEHTPVRRRR